MRVEVCRCKMGQHWLYVVNHCLKSIRQYLTTIWEQSINTQVVSPSVSLSQINKTVINHKLRTINQHPCLCWYHSTVICGVSLSQLSSTNGVGPTLIIVPTFYCPNWHPHISNYPHIVPSILSPNLCIVPTLLTPIHSPKSYPLSQSKNLNKKPNWHQDIGI